MKLYLKLSIILVLFFISNPIYGQKLFIKGGLNFSTMYWKSKTYNSIDLGYKTGYNIGGAVEFPTYKFISVETGLIYTEKGYYRYRNWVENKVKVEEETNLDLSYFEIPLKGKFTYNLGNIQVFGILGAYISVGDKGSVQIETRSNGYTERLNRTIVWDADPPNISFDLMDHGLIFGAGIEIYLFQLETSYLYGLRDISTANFRSIINNRVFYIDLGIRLN